MAPPPRCPGTLNRRAFLHAGLSGLTALGLPDLLRLEARAAADGRSPTGRKSIIVLWLWGGPSHMETFDLKPDAPAEFRGEFRPIPTNVPGIAVSEHLPLLARHADKFSLIRSLHHDSPGHVNSTHTLLCGYPGEAVETPPYQPKHPDFWSVSARLLGGESVAVPFHVALPSLRYNGAAYLGRGLEPLNVGADPSADGFRVSGLSVPSGQREGFGERLGLLERLDRTRRDLDASGVMASLDRFNERAVALLTSADAARAFELRREDPRTRDRYGRHLVGQRLLLARRLVEAGVRLVTVDFPSVPGQKAFSWDDHASVWNIFEQMKIRLPVLDRVVSALLEDLHDRGLDREVLVLVMGEMSHTPKLSNFQGQPGREHWSRAMSVLVAGGGLPMGQVIGATNHKGEEPSARPVSPEDLLATLYHYLGVPVGTAFTDATGRPVPLLPGGAPLRELV
jgi:uncharacterized protein (DUF1501 family)